MKFNRLHLAGKAFEACSAEESEGGKACSTLQPTCDMPR
jgi:hypothetical protein